MLGLLIVSEQPVVSRAMPVEGLLQPIAWAKGGVLRAHRDAVNRTGRNTQLTTGTQLGEHRVHLLRGTQDRIEGTSGNAFGAADAGRLIDHRHLRGAPREIGKVKFRVCCPRHCRFSAHRGIEAFSCERPAPGW